MRIFILIIVVLFGCRKSPVVKANPVVMINVDSVFYLGWHDQRTFLGTIPVQDFALDHFWKLIKAKKYYDGYYLIGKDASVFILTYD